MTDKELAQHLAQSIYSALFALSNEGDIEKAEDILDRANDFAEDNDLL